MHKHRSVVAWLIGALVLSVVFTAVRNKEGDSPVYRRAALRYMNGEQIYRPSDDAAFTYPPFFVFAYIPFALLPQPVDRAAWTFVNLLLLGYILHVLRRMTAPAIQASSAKTKVPLWLAQLIIGGFALRYLVSPLEYQGHDLIVFALFITGLAALALEQNVRSGFWSGLAAACKATPLLMLVPFFWQRRWSALVGCLLTVCLATVLPDALVGNPDQTLWAQSWYDKFLSHVDIATAPNAAGAWNSWNMLNQSLSGTMYRLFTPVAEPTERYWNVCLLPLTSSQLAIASALAKLMVLALVSYAVLPRHYGKSSDFPRGYLVLNQAAAVVSGMLLLSPMSSKQHFCVLVIPISVLVIDWLYFGRNRTTAAILAFTFLLGTLAGKDIVGAAAHQQLGAYGSLTWCTFGYLLGSCHIAGRIKHVQQSVEKTIPVASASDSPRSAAA